MNNIAFPRTVDLAITGRCNLRCKHCNTSDTWNADNEFSFDGIIMCLDQLKNEKIFNLNLFGGEPFFYSEIFKLLELLNSYPMRITILTNGTLIDKKAVGVLKNMRFLENIQISIDGSNAEIHDWQRGKGAYDASLRAVELLNKNDLPVSIKAIINRYNYDDIGNMFKVALKLGLDGMDFGDAVECGRAAVYANDMKFNGEMHARILETMFQLREEYSGYNIGGTLGQKIGMLEEFYENGSGGGTRGTFSTCPAGFNMLSIRSDGKVVPCSAFWTLVCGDIRKQSLREIWDNSDVLNKIRALADEPLINYGDNCEDCDYLSYCNGGCRAAAYYSSSMDLKGIDIATCLVFSSIYGYRLAKEKILPEMNR